MGPPSTDALAGMGFEDSFAWFAQGQAGAEVLGAAGGFVYGNGFDLL